MFNFDINIVFIPLILVLLAIFLLDKLLLKQRKKHGVGKESFIIRQAYDFLPILLLIVSFRSFAFDYNKIPSDSMVPTIVTGDYIIVNKYKYGVRLPIINTKIIDIDTPRRGDVVVFRYPEDPKVSYIKRAIGIAGDEVEFKNGQLSINGHTVIKELNTNEKIDDYSHIYNETIHGKTYKIRDIKDYTIAEHASFLQEQNPDTLRMNLSEHWKVTIPEGQYFMMGDNRDESADSRFWGFVPEKNLVGKAEYVFIHKKEGLNIPSFKTAQRIN